MRSQVPDPSEANSGGSGESAPPIREAPAPRALGEILRAASETSASPAPAAKLREPAAAQRPKAVRAAMSALVVALYVGLVAGAGALIMRYIEPSETERPRSIETAVPPPASPAPLTAEPTPTPAPAPSPAPPAASASDTVAPQTSPAPPAAAPPPAPEPAPAPAPASASDTVAPEAAPPSATLEPVPEPKAEPPSAAPSAVAAEPPAPMPAPAIPAAAAPESAILMARGEELLRQGDVAAARLFFERAAGEGQADAALRAGDTYNPALLASWGVRGMEGDTAQAAAWYRRARELGAGEAEERLKGLAAQ